MKKQPCSHPGCTAVGEWRVENDNWLCTPHIQERLNSPAHIALHTAVEDQEAFLDGGGNLFVTAPMTLTSVAYHEAGHAVANVLAWQYADYTNESLDRLLGGVEISECSTGIRGACDSEHVYSTRWPAHERIHIQWRSAMEWRIVSAMAGGIAEAVFRGERRQGKVYGFASVNCGMMISDMDAISDLMDDLYLLTRRRHGPQRFAVRALRLVQAQWPAVEALATALQANHYIDGDTAQEIVERNLTWCPIERRHLGVE